MIIANLEFHGVLLKKKKKKFQMEIIPQNAFAGLYLINLATGDSIYNTGNVTAFVVFSTW